MVKSSEEVSGVGIEAHCCSGIERCCGDGCCDREQTCCKDTRGNTTIALCCPAGCCKNSRGKIACCPELGRQLLIVFGVVAVGYGVVAVRRAIRTYYNIRPVDLDNFAVLDEAHVRRMKYFLC